MGDFVCQGPECHDVQLTDDEFDFLPVIQWMLRILCFFTGILMVNAWKKEVRIAMGWEDEMKKPPPKKVEQTNFVQEFVRRLNFCLSPLSRLMSFVEEYFHTLTDARQSSCEVDDRWQEVNHAPRTEAPVFRKHPKDEDPRAVLESSLSQLALFTNDKTKSARGLSSSQLKDEIHANLLAQRALRGAIQIKKGYVVKDVVKRVYELLSRSQIAIGKGTFELMVQTAVCSDDTQTARVFLARMEACGHKANDSLVLLLEDDRRRKANDYQQQATHEIKMKAAEITECVSTNVKNNSLDGQVGCSVPEPIEVPRTALGGVCPEVPCTSLAADFVQSPSEMPYPAFAPPWIQNRCECSHFQGVDAMEPGTHHFLGHITVVDIMHPTEDFDGHEWLRKKLVDKEPIGWDIEWRPDLDQTTDNPVALMQFASKDFCLLLRTHRTGCWLPNVVLRILCSEDVPKISYDYHVADRQKIVNSFGFQPAGVVDIMQQSQQRGLVFRGLRDLAKHFGIRMKKDPRLSCSDWACPGDLTREQVQYAAEDAYFAYLIHTELNSGIADGLCNMNLATQQIVDNMLHANMFSQNHGNHTSHLHVTMPAFPVPYGALPIPMFPYQSPVPHFVQCAPAVDNCRFEGPFQMPEFPIQNSCDPWEVEDPWRAPALNNNEPINSTAPPNATNKASEKKAKKKAGKADKKANAKKADAGPVKPVGPVKTNTTAESKAGVKKKSSDRRSG